MQYMLLIYEDEAAWASATPEQQGAILGEYQAFTQEIVATGEFKAGDALREVATATSVRVRDGEVMVTDGPFAETREQLGGYYLIECENLDRALEIAGKLPAAKAGTVEVRPVLLWE